MDTSDDIIILKIIFEEDDDDVLLWYLSEEKRKGHDPLFQKISTEGYNKIHKNIFKSL
jgi:hypothetical protein